jgi:hypothetical protein
LPASPASSQPRQRAPRSPSRPPSLSCRRRRLDGVWRRAAWRRAPTGSQRRRLRERRRQSLQRVEFAGRRPTASRAASCCRPAAARAARSMCTRAAWAPGCSRWRQEREFLQLGAATSAARPTSGAGLLPWASAAAAGGCRQRRTQPLLTLAPLPHSLPRELLLRETPQQFARRHAAALLHSPAGTALSYYAAGGLVFSVLTALHGAWCR